MEEIVHSGGGHFPGVQRDERELVHLEARHYAQGSEEGVADAIFSQGAQLLDLPVEELEPDVGDARVRDVDGPEGGADRLEDMFNLNIEEGV